MRAVALALCILFALCGCATAQSPLPRLFYVGLGMFDETWSENDVAALTSALQHGAPGFRVIPTIFANASGHHPAVEPGAVATTLSAIADDAGPNDVVLVYISTHGAPGLLGRSAAGDELEPFDAAQLRAWLAPLRDHDTVLILSACFSGSFIPPLRAPHRVIFAAARADRTSFGCQAGAEHTVFGDALLRALRRPRESLRSIVAATRATVTARERALRVDLPSQPQLSVGPAATLLFDAPDLLNPDDGGHTRGDAAQSGSGLDDPRCRACLS